MKPRGIIWLSLALNVALAATIFLSAKKTPVPDQAATASQPIAGTSSQPAAATNNPAPAGPPFLWSQIASENLKIYRDHLLAIGCPKITMREIIRAVINERFGMRRRGILASFQDRYWDMVLHRELVRRQWLPRTEWGQALESLKAERLQLITDVLGRDALITEAERQARRAELEQQRSWLSPEKRGQLIELGGKTPATIGGLG